MKRTRITIIVTLMLIACFAGSAAATSLNFIGPAYRLSDADGDGFSEELSLNSALVSLVSPNNDNLFGDSAWETVVFSDFYLDPNSYVSGERYDFSDQNYVNGLSVYDDDHSLLFDADLSLSALEVNGGTGEINPLFSMNLSNIAAAPDYVIGSSEIVDSLLDSSGALSVTMQLPDSDMGGMIERGDSFSSTYSGSAAPMPTPEPGTVLLIGSGLLGIAGMARKKRK